MNPEEPKSVTLTVAQWQSIVTALGKFPYEQAAPLINAIVKQVSDEPD